jgi:hypothetical protein
MLLEVGKMLKAIDEEIWPLSLQIVAKHRGGETAL